MPKWVFEPKDTEGTAGQDVIIKCDAFAKPVPRYQWARNNIPIEPNARFIVTGGTLLIRNVVREDTATYTCIAVNNSGKIEANVMLFVLIPPDIALMDDITVVEGNKATLRCKVREAFPKAQIRWKISLTNEYIQPGKPQQNAYVERFNRTVRYEWLSQYHWSDLEEVRLYATNWMWMYNNERPNMALGGITPKQRLAMAA
jgi:putative transposase